MLARFQQYKSKLLALLQQGLAYVILGYVCVLPISKWCYVDAKTFVLGTFFKTGITFLCIAIAVLGGMPRRILGFLSILTGCFLVGQHWAITSEITPFDFETHCRIFLKWIFGFLAVGSLYFIDKKQFSILKKAFRYLLKLVYLNAWAIIIGFVFNIEWFKSYPNTPRFGYSGFLLVTTLMLVGLGVFYHRYVSQKKGGFRLLITFIAVLLIGKKMLYLYVLLLLGHYVYLLYRKSFYALLLLGSVSFGIAFFYIETLLEYIPFWKALYEKKGLLSALTSLRSDLFVSAVDFVQEHWSIFPVFSGSLLFPTLSTEFGVVDIFFYFGIVGLVVFGVFVKKVLFLKQQPTYNYMIVTFLITDALSGTVLNTVAAMLMIALWHWQQRCAVDN